MVTCLMADASTGYSEKLIISDSYIVTNFFHMCQTKNSEQRQLSNKLNWNYVSYNPDLSKNYLIFTSKQPLNKRPHAEYVFIISFY